MGVYPRRTRRTGLFWEVFGLVAGGVGGIVAGEGGAEPERGMGAGPELDEGVGVGVDEGIFAEELEGGLAGLLGVGDDTLYDLFAVDVGCVLVRAGEGVLDGFAEEVEGGEDEHEDVECGPVVLCGDPPLLAEAAEQELEEVEAEEEGDEDKDERKEEAADDVAEDVVTHLVAEDEEDLVGGGFGDRGIPDDDALGGTEAGDVGVEGGDLVGGLHEKHAVGRDGDAFSFGDDLLELGDEGGVGFLERLEFVEERVDDIGGEEDAEEDEGAEDAAGRNPPATGELADEEEEDHDSGTAEEPGEGGGDGEVAEPAGPALDAETVDALFVLVVEVDGQAEQGAEEQELEEEEEALGPAIFRQVDGDVAEPCGKTELQDEDEREDEPEFSAEVGEGADGGEMLGFLERGGWEGIGGVILGGGGDGGGFGGGGLIQELRVRGGAGDEAEEREQQREQSAEAHGFSLDCDELQCA
jgi:hypothetical protein